jgi:hypothetical protein
MQTQWPMKTCVVLGAVILGWLLPIWGVVAVLSVLLFTLLL